MTHLYYRPEFLEHDTGAHPENAERLRAIVHRLGKEDLLAACSTSEFDAIEAATLTSLHSARYLSGLDDLAKRGGGRVDPDTLVSPASAQVARLAAGAVGDAVRTVTSGASRRALCLVRPPGHHALARRTMGFCLINNVAIGARRATDELGLDRVLIVDWDVHHGNGTQDLFYDDPRVGYFSIHRWPFYPGTGDNDETGKGAGLGATRNLPITYGMSREDYLAYFDRELESFADRMKPQLVLISAGFDSHHDDPLGSLGLESEDFIHLTRTVTQIAQTHAEGRLVSVLEGGYNPEALAESVSLHLGELLNQDAKDAKRSLTS